MSFTDKQEDAKGKSKLAAFLLSFFLGALGVDWFYLCNGDAAYIVAGVFKLLTLGMFDSSILLLRFLIQSSSSHIRNMPKLKTYYFHPLGMLGIWWLVDWIRILADSFPDGNGDPLNNDM